LSYANGQTDKQTDKLITILHTNTGSEVKTDDSRSLTYSSTATHDHGDLKGAPIK